MSAAAEEESGVWAQRRFYGREWVWTKLWNQLEQRGPKASQPSAGLLVVGGPGAGKTTLCRQLIQPEPSTPAGTKLGQLHERLLAHHVCHAQAPESLSVPAFIQSVVDQCAQSPHLPQLGARLRHPEILAALDPHFVQHEPNEAFKKAILFPLLETDPPPHNLLLLVESLDETGPLHLHWKDYSWLKYAAHTPQASAAAAAEEDSSLEASHGTAEDDDHEPEDPCQSIAELLAAHHHLFPRWLFLMVTARRQNKSVTRLFTGLRKLALDEVRRASVVRDVQQYILSRLENEPALRRHLSRETAPNLNLLHIKSHGCFLYVETVLDGVVEGSILLRDIPEIPGTLNGLYLWLCQRLFPRKTWAKITILLSLLLSAPRPPTPRELREAALTAEPTMTESDFRRRLQLLQRVTRRDHEGVVVFHPSFAEWLGDVKHCTQRFLVSAAQGHARWALVLAARGSSLSPKQADDLAYHLSVAEIQLPLEAFHLPLLFLWSGAPWPDPAAMEVMVSSLGARQEEAAAEQQQLYPTEEAPPEETMATVVVSEVAEIQEEETAAQETEPAEERRGTMERTGSGSSIGGPSLSSEIDPVAALFHAIELGQPQLARRILTHFPALRNNGDCSTLRHALALAARQGQAQLAALLVDSGVEADSADAEGWTPLRAAAWGGHAATVQVLLERGATVDAADSEGRTALRASAWAGHEDVVRLLVAAGADVNGADKQGRTPLIAAAYMGHADIVGALLATGAQPDAADCEGRTALSVAVLSMACRSSGRAARRLPARSDLVHTQARRRFLSELENGEKSLHGTRKATEEWSEEEGCGAVAILIEHGADVNHADKEGMTPLLVAAFEGHRVVCELLLEAEADPDQADAHGRTPLLAAASMGHADIVELLLFWGCYVDSIDAEGRTVLSVAAAQGSVAVVKRLLDRGLDEMHRDNAGWTPLHYAAFEGHAAVVDLLVEAGAKCDAADNDGRSPLLLSAQEGHTSTVERLLGYGAKPDHRALDSKTPLRAAALGGHASVIRMLLDHQADPNFRDVEGQSTLYVLALDDRVRETRVMLEWGLDHPDNWARLRLDADRDLEGRTPLHVAAWQGHTAMVELLLTVGRADPNVIDNEQRTPLHNAAWQGHEAVVWLLLQHGAQVDLPCSQGATPLSIAAQEGHEAVAKLLLREGADPHRADRCGRTAFKLATKGGHTVVLRLLENWQDLKRATPQWSLDSRGSAETKPSSAILVQRMSSAPSEPSPASTLDIAAAGNAGTGTAGTRSNTSSGKSSSDLASSTTQSSKHSMDRIAHTSSSLGASDSTSPLAPAAFMQQLQAQALGGSARSGLGPRSQVYVTPRVLSPLSEPQSPLYASPPPLSPWQRVAAEDDDERDEEERVREKVPVPPLRTWSSGTPVPLYAQRHTTQSEDSISSPRTSRSSLGTGLDGAAVPINPVSRTCFTAPPISLTQSGHMQIILGPPKNNGKRRRHGWTGAGATTTSSGASSSGGVLSHMLAGWKASAFVNGSSKLKNALSAVTRPLPLKKETPL